MAFRRFDFFVELMLSRVRKSGGAALPSSFILHPLSFCTSSGVRERLRGGDSGDELAALLGQGAEITLDLKPLPKALGLAEERSKTNGHGRGDGALAEENLIDGAWRHLDGAGHGVLGNPHGIEIFLQQDFSGCD